MKTVTVNASRTYDIHIGSGLLDTLGTHIKALGGVQSVCIVSETTVFSLYGSRAMESLRNAGLPFVCYVFSAGEASKNGRTYLELLNVLAENELTRSDLVVALGGGVVGDLAGFAAATFLRGIRFIQVPTTLLAAVDSSVGGKTAIDLPAGKNLAGAFYQPSLVLCDTDCLLSLPESIFQDGCAETIKYGVLYDPDLFAHLEEKGLDFDRETVISRCVELKRDVVNQDEYDTGARMKLNLGHTIGHGIEAKSEFTLSHGRAVAIGMAMISRGAEKKGLLSREDAARIQRILPQFGLPTETSYTSADLYRYMLSDKKRSGGTVKLIVPRRIGSCDILPVPVKELEGWIRAGM